MEVTPLPQPDATDWADRFQIALSEQREQLERFLQSGEERFEQAEGDLLELLERLAEEVAAGRAETATARADIEQQTAQLQQRGEQLEADRAHLGQQRAQLEKLREEIDARAAQWQQLDQAAFERQQQALAELRSEHERLEQRNRQLLERDTAEQDQLRKQLEAEHARCRELDDRLAAIQRDLEAQRSGCEQRDAQIEKLRAELDAEHQRVRQAIEQREQSDARLHAAQEEREQLNRQLAEQQQRCRKLEGELDTLRGQVDALKQRAEAAEEAQAAAAEAAASAGVQVDASEFEELHRERDMLIARSVELESELERARQELEKMREAPDESGDEGGEYARRYEMAMDDVRELRAENDQLRQQLKEAQAGGGSKGGGGGGPAPAPSGGALDWEAEKQRILAALEAEGDDGAGDEPERTHRRHLEIQEVVERTDRVIAEKNRELAEMKQLLEEQSSSVGSLAVGAAALEEVLDKDEIIREERENLTRLQEQWREKLRKAEVEISVERAKIGRERAQLEEKLQTLEKQGPAGTANDTVAGTEKPARGRWLAQLGLKGKDEEEE